MLRIDDDLNPGDRPGIPGYDVQRPPRHLHSIEFTRHGQLMVGLRSWADLIEFWRQFDPKMVIDLIISDVKFLDPRSPLGSAGDGEPLELPTGLNHFKAFAAIARATGRPLGVGLHTKDSRMWRAAAADKAPERRMMGLLAAQEAGELAAILGEANTLSAITAEGAWSWFENRTLDSPDFRDAIPGALCQFRQRLGEVRLSPSDYEGLVQWCARMDGSALTDDPEAPVTRCLDDEHDLGWPLRLPDGQVDLISFRSLFADVELVHKRFQFEYEGLPRRCFAVVRDDEFADLQGGFPRFGSLIHQCGEGARCYAAAASLAKAFPAPGDGPSGRTFASVREANNDSPLATALAVLFIDLQREHALELAWRNLYVDSAWTPHNDAFTGEPPTQHLSLQQWVKRAGLVMSQNDEMRHADLRSLFADFGALPLEEEDPDDDLLPLTSAERLAQDAAGGGEVHRQRPLSGTRRCLDLLVELGFARYIPQQRRFVPVGDKLLLDQIPRRPERLPANFLRYSLLGDAFTGSKNKELLAPPSSTVRMLCGYHASGNAILERSLAAPFEESNTWGTKFFETFRSGGCSNDWMISMCREFAAKELGWTEEATWPNSIRSPSRR